jgi:hypothetical protein
VKVLHCGAQHHAANAAKSVDADFGGHVGFTFVERLMHSHATLESVGETIVSQFMKLCYSPDNRRGFVLVL